MLFDTLAPGETQSFVFQHIWLEPFMQQPLELDFGLVLKPQILDSLTLEEVNQFW